MDERPRLSKHSYKISIESRRSNISSCRSLQRPSWCEREKSLSKNHSLLDVMSLQGGRKSDFYQHILDENSEPIIGRQSVGANVEGYNYTSNYQENYYHNNYNYLFEGPQGLNQRKSEQASVNIKHVCGCYTECQWRKCECFEAKNQICVKGQCCVGCIDMKMKMMADAQAPAQPAQQTVICTCKKTKCNKKYCSCFAAGQHCGPKCLCEGCINCPRKSQHMQVESEREEINQQQLKRMQMPECMDFEPVQFRFSNP